MKSQMKKTILNRRTFLKGAGMAIAGTALAACAPPAAVPSASTGPTIIVPKIQDITLRQIGTGVSAFNEVRDQAMKDLGFKLEYKVVDTDTNNQTAVTQPKSFDIFDGEYFSLPLVFPAGNLRALDIKKIKEFDKIAGTFTTGKLTKDSVVAQGTAPSNVMFLKDEGSVEFAGEPTGWATLIPTQYNADTLGIRPDLIKRPISKWSELLNSEFKGKASILNIPSIGIMDAAMVMESAGFITYTDKGNMTQEEIDKTIEKLIEAKKDGQFRAFWKTFDESVNLMSSGEVVIQSMWSPAVTAVKAKGIQCVYQPLTEGYRAWGGGIGLSKNLSGMALDAAYDYINWWNSGWAGSFIGRQGYYSAIPENAKKFMSADEWDFWYEGKPAATDMLDPFGKKLESKGAVRDGGSFTDRMGKVACWNSVMKEQNYMVKRWNEFIAA